MEFYIRGNIEITDAIRNYVESKLVKINKYFKQELKVNIAVNTYHHGKVQKIEVTIPIEHLVLRAEESHYDLYSAIDHVVEKLERQIRKQKTKNNRNKREGTKLKEDIFIQLALNQQIDDADYDQEPEDITDLITREKTLDLKPMNIEEATLRINLIGHPFFVFLNSETNKVNVIYARNKKGTYGLLIT
jgi:putative sigma-54 modulation protein